MHATILIVDGWPASRSLLASCFCQSGFHVKVADNGLDCLIALQERCPQLLLVDLDSTWGGAPAVAAFFRGAAGRVEMPITVLLASESPDVTSRRTGVPESCCFQKPVSLEGLLDQVGLAVALIDLRCHALVDNTWS